MRFKIPSKRERAVRRGIKLLNQQVPNWWQAVRLDSLDMMSADRCVLGQLATAHDWDRSSFNPYGTGATRLGLTMGEDCRRYGFDTLEFGSTPEYRWLTERWRQEIQKRQSVPV